MPHACATSRNTATPSITISTATGQRITSTTTAHLNIPTLPSDSACIGRIMPGFTNNLISIGRHCNEGCMATFTRQAIDMDTRSSSDHAIHMVHNCGISTWSTHTNLSLIPAAVTRHYYHQRPLCPSAPPRVMTTPQQHHSLLRATWVTTNPQQHHSLLCHLYWTRRPSRPTAPPTANNETHKWAYALIEYLHATAGYPAKATWLVAIKAGNYTSWTGLTLPMAQKYCPDTDETI